MEKVNFVNFQLKYLKIRFIYYCRFHGGFVNSDGQKVMEIEDGNGDEEEENPQEEEEGYQQEEENNIWEEEEENWEVYENGTFTDIS
jgi:hypothetical protein